MMRFFRTATETYESIRLELDAAWGLPNESGVVTCLRPVGEAHRDADGKVVCAISQEFCQYPVAIHLLPQLLASGAVEEIDEPTYRECLPSVP